MVEQLRNWLNGSRDYATGVAIYGQLGDNAALKTVLQKGRTEYLQQRLESELDAIYDIVHAAPITILPSTPRPYNLNPVLENAADQTASQLYKKMMNDRAVLFSLARQSLLTDANQPDLVDQRRQLAISICEQNYAVSKAYEQLDHIRRYGVLPGDAPAEEAPVPDAQVKSTIDNIRKNLSKMRQREQTPERVALIQQHEQHLQILLERWQKIKA